MKYFFAILLSAVLLAACAAPAVKSEPMPTNQPAGALSGRLIFGRAGEDGKYHLELIDLETRETHVYTGKGNRIAPSFSPDGQRFVFAADAAVPMTTTFQTYRRRRAARFTTFSAAESNRVVAGWAVDRFSVQQVWRLRYLHHPAAGGNRPV